VSARPTGDVYLTLLSTSASGRSATIRLAVNPLVDWVWLGGAMMALGGLVALRRRRARSAAAAAPAIEEVPAPVAVSRP
jgi:cytochrome c-type biogenesis protein CcmF